MSEIKEEITLIKVDTQNNSNKFYHAQLLDNNDVITRWGRVGSTATTKTYTGVGKTGYDKIIKAKTGKGYEKTKIVANQNGTSKVDKEELKEIASRQLSVKPNREISKLVTKLVELNRHNLMEKSGGLIQVNLNGQITTPLGLIDREALQTADKLLQEITQPDNQKPTAHAKLVEKYLTLVPQKVPAARGWESNFLIKEEDITQQKTLVDQLSASLDWYDTQKQLSASDQKDIHELNKDLFRMKLQPVSPWSKTFRRINKYYNSTRSLNHKLSYNLRLLNVYEVQDTKRAHIFERKVQQYGNVKELWHGTDAANILSILTKGYFVPDAKDGIHITGRLFGNGVYASNISTKSLNYATGYWNGKRTNTNCFMLLNDIVMGHEFRPAYWNSKSVEHSRTGVGRSGKPYQSINIKGGTCGVVNNEMIVWDTDQISIKYLCEFGQ